jgi:hypothetical protein
MKTTNQKAVLMERIKALQTKQSTDFQDLKIQYQMTIDSFKTVNLIKTSLQEIITTPNLTSNLIGGTLGMGTSYLLKTVLSDNNKNPIKKILGKVVKLAIKSWVGRK